MGDMWSQMKQVVLNALPDVVAGLIVLGVVLLLGRLVARAMALWVERHAPGARRRPSHIPVRLVRGAFAVLAVVLALQTAGMTRLATSLLATGGLLAIVLGFAFKEIGENLLAGLLLSISRSFDVGDLIESDGYRGIVRSIKFREVHIRSADGKDVFIPSAAIFRNALQNYTLDGLRQGSFLVGIDYGDDPEEARRIVELAISQCEGVLRDPAPRAVVHELGGNWVELRGTFWIDTFGGGAPLPVVRGRVLTAVRERLAAGGFTFSSNVSSAHTVDITKH